MIDSVGQNTSGGFLRPVALVLGPLSCGELPAHCNSRVPSVAFPASRTRPDGKPRCRDQSNSSGSTLEFGSGVQDNIFFWACEWQRRESSWLEDIQICSAPGHLMPPGPCGQLGHRTWTRFSGALSAAHASSRFGWFCSGFLEPLRPAAEGPGGAQQLLSLQC